VGKILVIDDDPDMVLAARICLEHAGYEVNSACSVEDGLKQLQADRPDLILLDVMMNTPTEGFQFALRLRNPNSPPELAPFRDVPILIFSAIHATTPLRFEADKDYLPVDGFIDKPLDPGRLVEKVGALLRRGG
jgi:DNA-binding response OmpR family regulator